MSILLYWPPKNYSVYVRTKIEKFYNLMLVVDFQLPQLI